MDSLVIQLCQTFPHFFQASQLFFPSLSPTSAFFYQLIIKYGINFNLLFDVIYFPNKKCKLINAHVPLPLKIILKKYFFI